MTDTQRTAIVTGGGSGIGRTVAHALAEAGWRVVIAGRRQDTLDQTIAAAKGEVVAIVADITDEQSVDMVFDQTIRRFGRVDLLFNNAGVNAAAKPVDELSVAEVRAVLDTNIVGSVLCARAAMRVMKAQTPQGGRIINNGSVSAYAPRPNQVAYTVSKSAITGLTKSIGLDGRAFGIACSQIDIGNATTEMSAYMQQGAVQANGSIMPEPRMSSAHVAATIVHMAGLPIEANIPFVTVMATNMPLYGRG